MADEADLAADTIEQELAIRMRERRPMLKAIGQCHNCEDPLGHGIFCDALCREDFERREDARRRSP